ncbi:MAG TPA: cupin domain-containing protein [Spongiibacteraceae bacterium]|nr:cupin domain-containing protein [Spongiibacteraceae bacterium]
MIARRLIGAFSTRVTAIGARTILFAAQVLVTQIFATQAYAGACDELRLDPAEIAAMPTSGAGAGTSGVQGIRTTVVCGDPSGSEPYVIALSVPKNTHIAAHTHRDQRTAAVVQGLWHFGYGDKAIDAATKALKPGSIYIEPAGKAHFAYTTEEGAVVYIFGNGPTDTRYVDSK